MKAKCTKAWWDDSDGAVCVNWEGAAKPAIGPPVSIVLICSAGGNCGGWWEALQKGRHIFREGLGKGQPLPGDGVAEGELRRVQGRPPDQPRILPAIEEVPHQGMAQPGEMDPDLVSSPGLQLQTEQGNSLCLPYCLVPGAGRLPVRADALLHQRALPGTQRGVHCPGGRLRRALTHRQISAVEVRCVQLPLQDLLGVWMAGHHHQAGSPAVQTVDRVEIALLTP